MFAPLARASEERMCNFKAQELANTAWAFAVASQVDNALFVALARASAGRVHNSKPHNR